MDSIHNKNNIITQLIDLLYASYPKCVAFNQWIQCFSFNANVHANADRDVGDAADDDVTDFLKHQYLYVM